MDFTYFELLSQYPQRRVLRIKEKVIFNLWCCGELGKVMA